MERRQFLELATGTVAIGVTPTADAMSNSDGFGQQPPGMAWQRAFEDVSLDAVVPAHGDGHVLVGRGRSGRSPASPVVVLHVDGTGTVRRRRSLDPGVGEDARRAGADVERTDSGYVIASGPWFAGLDAEFTVEATGSASGFGANHRTRVVELDDSVAVATDWKWPNHASTRVLGFGSDGDHRWTCRFSLDGEALLGFLLDGDGVVVGGAKLGSGKPWMASVAPDGTKRWQGVVTDAPTGFGAEDATSDGSGFTVLGRSGLMRLTGAQSVVWRTGDRLSGVVLDRTTDGGYVLVGQAGKNHVRVARANQNGSLQWSHEYPVPDEGTAGLRPSAIVEHETGEYLVVGSRFDDSTGWMLSLSTAVEPTTTTTRDDSTTSKTSTSRNSTAVSTKSSSGTLDGLTRPVGLAVGILGLGAGWWMRRR